MEDHVHGTMDTGAQEKTFEGFVKFSARAVIAFLVILALLAIFNA
ncbi:aa3 type cytochrome c oxidase subunit IV [Aliiroseovarius sediminilitoris]|uniref:Aa3 type cytochrome c oxidase subunit IV n=1 Tax=Aliiroseovarius sediminilitoris TaxID=1173584 RepID=A0A1I0N277_9RHOB|nr:aa3-type cytochrome c oxidase subunit IV [Aliiroseovarius sediminilitoris]SEV94847.1 aa3 type cytochrome c oxidase subunit IV [Aliiroseovarius sediminilitoris]